MFRAGAAVCGYRWGGGGDADTEGSEGGGSGEEIGREAKAAAVGGDRTGTVPPVRERLRCGHVCVLVFHRPHPVPDCRPEPGTEKVRKGVRHGSR